MHWPDPFVTCQNVEDLVPQTQDSERLGPSFLVRSHHRKRAQPPQPLTHPCDEPVLSVSVALEEQLPFSRTPSWSKVSITRCPRSPAKGDYDTPDGRVDNLEEVAFPLQEKLTAVDVPTTEYMEANLFSRPLAVSTEVSGCKAGGSCSSDSCVSEHDTDDRGAMETDEQVGDGRSIPVPQVVRTHTTIVDLINFIPVAEAQDSDLEFGPPVTTASPAKLVLGDLCEEEARVFEIPDTGATPLLDLPLTCCQASLQPIPFKSSLFGEWHNAEVGSAREGINRLLHPRDDQLKSHNLTQQGLRISHYFSPHDAESYSTASVPEVTDSASSSTSSRSDSRGLTSQSGCACRGELEESQKHLWDDRPEDGDHSPNAKATVTCPHRGIDNRHPGSCVPASEGLDEIDRVEPREKSQPMLRLPGQSVGRVPHVPGPPFSPRAPFCASHGFFQSPGFVFSDLEVHAETGGDAEGSGGFSRSNSMTTDVPFSRMNSVTPSIAEEDFSMACKASREAAAGDRGHGLENLAEQLSRLTPSVEERTACGYSGIRLGGSKTSSYSRKCAYESSGSWLPTRDAANLSTFGITTSPLGYQIADVWRDASARFAQVVTSYSSSSEPFQRNVL